MDENIPTFDLQKIKEKSMKKLRFRLGPFEKKNRLPRFLAPFQKNKNPPRFNSL